MFSGIVLVVTGGQRVHENTSELGLCVCCRLSHYNQKGGKSYFVSISPGLYTSFQHVSSGQEHEGDGERHVGKCIGRGEHDSINLLHVCLLHMARGIMRAWTGMTCV